ncbi:unnamed protein product [Rotaria sordida]|uniref:Uncharacterized protein n=1 Tax=Rotaria sordida TaxID=392033 RepID=A0A814P726_9BILA|nr:unnamed protein product [Rotaria sordida]CAF1308917.1 unnamed protein product [Rotaria sordida]
MATIDESNVSPRQFHHRQFLHLQPLSPRVPSSIERHFEQYLIDNHHYPKLPSISSKQINRQSIDNTFTNDKDFLSYRELQIPFVFEHDNGPISRLLNSDQYRRAQTRLIEYRQHSKIPGVSLTTTTTVKNSNELSPTQINERNNLTVPLKEILIETTKAKPHQQQDDIDFIDDDSIFSHESDRRRRAKHWIKEHQFFFTEYQ